MSEDKAFSGIENKIVERSDTHSILPRPTNRVFGVTHKDIGDQEYCRGYNDGSQETGVKLESEMYQFALEFAGFVVVREEDAIFIGSEQSFDERIQDYLEQFKAQRK